MYSSNSMEKGKSMDNSRASNRIYICSYMGGSNSKVSIKSNGAMATAERPSDGDV